jgi:hypothetical protein
VIEIIFRGVDGKPINGQQGYARETRRYDDRGFLLEWAYFNADGVPIKSSLGFARSVLVIDEVGDIKSEQFFDANGDPLAEVRIAFVSDNHNFSQDANGVRRAPLVTKVLPNSSAASAGVRENDVLMEFGTRSITCDLNTGKVNGLPLEIKDNSANLRVLRHTGDGVQERVLEVPPGNLGLQVEIAPTISL